MKRFASLGVLLVLLAGCGTSQDEIDAKTADARERGFAIVSSGDGGIGGDVYVHVVFGKDNKCSGTVWYNDDAVTLQAELTVPGSAVKGKFAVNDPRTFKLPHDLVSTNCFS